MEILSLSVQQIKEKFIIFLGDVNCKSLFEKSFWAKLFARKPSFFFKTRFLPQSRKAYTIQTHIIIIFSKPCQINDRDLVFKPDGLGESTATPQCGSQWIAKSTALGDNLLLFKTGSKVNPRTIGFSQKIRP